MKDGIKIFLIITAVIFTFALFACDSLVAPIKERANPYDAYNPVPAPVDLSVGLEMGNDGNRIVPVSWMAGQNDALNTTIEGYIIFRQADSAPKSIWDGTLLGFWSTEDPAIIADNGYRFVDEQVDTDESYPVGRTVYYSIFSYGPKYDINDDERITVNEKGDLINYQNYQFTGPISGSMTIWDYVDMPVSSDRYMDSANNWHDSEQNLLVTTATSTPQTIAGIVFNLDNVPTQTVLYARLILTKYVVSPNGVSTMTVARWENTDWQTEINFADLADTAPAFNPVSDVFDVEVPEGDSDELSINLTDIYSMWADGATNAGISLRSNDGTNNFSFCASENGVGGPVLRLYFMY